MQQRISNLDIKDIGQITQVTKSIKITAPVAILIQKSNSLDDNCCVLTSTKATFFSSSISFGLPLELELESEVETGSDSATSSLIVKSMLCNSSQLNFSGLINEIITLTIPGNINAVKDPYNDGNSLPNVLILMAP